MVRRAGEAEHTVQIFWLIEQVERMLRHQEKSAGEGHLISKPNLTIGSCVIVQEENQKFSRAYY